MRRRLGSLFVVALTAAVATNFHRQAKTPRKSSDQDSGPAAVIIDELTRSSDMITFRLTLQNRSLRALTSMGFLRTPVPWICTSKDGVRWENPSAPFLGCLTGYGQFVLTRSEKGSSRRGLTKSELDFETWPHFKLGVAVFEGTNVDWVDGRVAWSSPIQVQIPEAPEILAASPQPELRQLLWPTIVGLGMSEPNFDPSRSAMAIVFESGDDKAVVTNSSSSALWIRDLDSPGVESVRWCNQDAHIDRSGKWMPMQDGKFRLNSTTKIERSALPRRFAIGITFQRIRGDDVRFRRIWSEPQSLE